MNEAAFLKYSLKIAETEEILRTHAAKYPKMQPTDAVKLLYQSALGPGHMISDENNALERTKAEIAVTSQKNDISEDIGGGFERLYLSTDMAELAPLVTKMFVMSANRTENTAERRQKFLESLEVLRKLTAEGVFSFSSAELDDYLTEYAAVGYPAVSHSDEYRTAYNPAYRVVKREYAKFFFIISELYTNAEKYGHSVLAIDGFCASGKSTFAEIFADLLGARLIHMDDFFLPPEKRTPERLAEAGGNVDYERFKAEVVDHLEDDSLTYGVFDCSEMAVTSHRTLEKTPVTIIEGSYSCHPYFGGYWHTSLFLESPEDEQLERIRLRDGEEMLENFKNRWIPMEKKYVRVHGIANKCDWRITVTQKGYPVFPPKIKNLYLIGGTMGIGKTTVCRELQKILPKNVFLDGDWCWDMRPFIVNDETKSLVMANIRTMLDNFLACSEFDNVIFCWVMHEQSIIDEILAGIHAENAHIYPISLTADESTLRAHLEKDISAGIRTPDVIERSLAYIPKYDKLNTLKIDVSIKSPTETARDIVKLTLGE